MVFFVQREKHCGLLDALVSPPEIAEDEVDEEEEEEEKEKNTGDEENSVLESMPSIITNETADDDDDVHAPRSVHSQMSSIPSIQSISAAQQFLDDKRRQELKQYGSRSSEFLHGYPVISEASVLLDAILVHYSRVGMVHEELLVAKQLNEQSVRLEMVGMFQANWRFKKWSRTVTARANWVREKPQRARNSEKAYVIRSRNLKLEDIQQKERAIFMRFDIASKKIQQVARDYLVRKQMAKEKRLEELAQRRQRALEIGAAAAAMEAADLTCPECGRSKKNYDEIRRCVQKHDDFKRRIELEKAAAIRQKEQARLSALKKFEFEQLQTAVEKKERVFLHQATLVRNKRKRAEQRKEAYLQRQGFYDAIEPERATLYLIRSPRFPSSHYYANLPTQIELPSKNCTFVLGRDVKKADVALDAPNHPCLISRAHVRIHIQKHFRSGLLNVHIEDLESTNGTFINGKEIFPLDVETSSSEEEEPLTFFSSSEEDMEEEEQLATERDENAATGRNNRVEQPEDSSALDVDVGEDTDRGEKEEGEEGEEGEENKDGEDEDDEETHQLVAGTEHETEQVSQPGRLPTRLRHSIRPGSHKSNRTWRSNRSSQSGQHSRREGKSSRGGSRGSHNSSYLSTDFGDRPPKYKMRTAMFHGDLLTLGCGIDKPSSLSQISYELEIRKDSVEKERMLKEEKKVHHTSLSQTLPNESIRLRALQRSFRKKATLEVVGGKVAV